MKSFELINKKNIASLQEIADALHELGEIAKTLDVITTIQEEHFECESHIQRHGLEKLRKVLDPMIQWADYRNEIAEEMH